MFIYYNAPKLLIMQKRGFVTVISFLFLLLFSLAVSAKLDIVTYCDASLEACRAQDQALVLLQEKYPQDITVHSLYYFDTSNAKSSMVQIALECAHRQSMKDVYKTEIQNNLNDLSRSALKVYASNVGLATANFTFCLDIQATAWDVLGEVLEAADDGVTSAPSVRFNMDMYSGSQTFTSLHALVKQYLGLSEKTYNKENEDTKAEDEETGKQEIIEKQPVEEESETSETIEQPSSGAEQMGKIEQPLFFRVVSKFRLWLLDAFEK